MTKDYSHEPMNKIFVEADTDKDGYLKKGEVSNALAKAGIIVVDEERAFFWLDRYFENRLSYKDFRRACEKATRICQECKYIIEPDSEDDSECEQEDLLRTYWIKFDPEKKSWCYADVVIDYLAADWGIEIDPATRVIERKLMGADEHGKINYRQFKTYFTQVPEEDLKHRVSSINHHDKVSMKNFENQLDEMLFGDSQPASCSPASIKQSPAPSTIKQL